MCACVCVCAGMPQAMHGCLRRSALPQDSSTSCISPQAINPCTSEWLASPSSLVSFFVFQQRL